MRSIVVNNVNEALIYGIELINKEGVNISPRGLETLEYPTPVATYYQRPLERVLFYPERDANPFFHFFEALWILAGRKDVAFLKQFNSRIEDYSDDGVSFHAAYGFRLRYALGIDQIRRVIDLLKADHRTRQAVLQIWNCQLDLGTVTKDMPCNDLIFLLVRNNKLNMTVCCRSNDMIWGAYGANVVQFSTLQEYIAAHLEIEVGSYTQISNSFHVYTGVEVWHNIKNLKEFNNPYYGEVKPYPLVQNPKYFDKELYRLLAGDFKDLLHYKFTNSYFSDVAVPMLRSWNARKQYKDSKLALDILDCCMAEDWRKACIEWIQRRLDHK